MGGFSVLVMNVFLRIYIKTQFVEEFAILVINVDYVSYAKTIKMFLSDLS